jgi:hypothetical protein
MSFWEGLWQIVLLVSVVGFAILTVVVGIGGLADIRAMLRRIEKRHESPSSGEPPVREE